MSDIDRLDRTRLPAAVYDLALRLGATAGANETDVRLKQSGHMLRSLESKSWMAFSATQTLSTRRCGFDWRARFGPLGVVSVRDAFENGEGCLDVKALGFIPIMRAKRTPALARGELMRYLAEIAMAPDAILHNADLRWRVDGPDTLAVSAGVAEISAEIVLSLDGDGRIAGTFAPDRPRSVTAPLCPRPGAGGSPTTDNIAAGGFRLQAKSPGKLTARRSCIGVGKLLSGRCQAREAHAVLRAQQADGWRGGAYRWMSSFRPCRLRRLPTNLFGALNSHAS